jgi:hypothetical protein
MKSQSASSKRLRLKANGKLSINEPEALERLGLTPLLMSKLNAIAA